MIKMIDHPEIPHLWNRVLHTVQMQYPKAFIAGGALRDLVCRKPVRDVDIFFYSEQDAEEVEVDVRSFCRQHYLGEPKTVEHETGSGGGFTSFNIDVSGQVYELCMVSVEKMEYILDRFDFGICQIAYDGKAWWCTEPFQTDIDNHTVTRLRQSVRLDHEDKLKEKFWDYRFIPQLDAYVPF